MQLTASRMKVAIIGSGRMARIYGDALAQRGDVRVTHVVGNTPEKTRALADRYGADAHADGRFEAALDASIDAFVLAAPEWIRLEPLRAVIATGRPVLVEKPLGASDYDLTELRKIPGDARARITVAHSLRFSPRFSQAHEAVMSGAVGDIRHMYSRRNPNFESVKRVLGRFDLVFWLSCHDVDLMRWFTGAEVSTVYAKSRSGAREADDYIIVQLGFDNGVNAVHEVSWCTPPLSPSAPTCSFSIKGTKGLVEIDDTFTGVSVYQEGERLTSPDTCEVYDVAGRQHGIFASLVDRWLCSVRGEAAAYPSFDDALRAVEVCATVRRSLESGKPERAAQ